MSLNLMRIGQAEQPAPARLDPHRLIVHRPVEDVGVAGLLQEVGGHIAGVDSGAEPAGRRPAFMSGDGFGGFPDERCLAGLVKVVLMLGIGAAVADDFIAAGAEGGDDLRAMVVQLRVQQNRDGQLQVREQVEKPPHTDAVAVLAPGPVVGVGMRNARRHRDAEPLAIGEVLHVEGDVERQSLALGPRVFGGGRRSRNI